MVKLATDVYVDDVRYAAGEEAPEGVSNPAAFSADEWARDSLSDPTPDVEPEPDDEEPEPDDEAPEAPPRDGPGASRAAWEAYAESVGVEAPEGGWRNRADIIAAVDAAQS